MAQNDLQGGTLKGTGNVSQLLDVGVDLLSENYIDRSGIGFYIKVNGNEGMLTVTPLDQNTDIRTKFTNGGDGWNILICRKIVAHSGNTATNIQVGR